MPQNKLWTNSDFESPRQVQHVPLAALYYRPRNPTGSPHKLILYHMCAMWCKFVAGPADYWARTDRLHPAQTNLSASDDQRQEENLLLDGGSCSGFGMSAGIWKMNLTISSPLTENIVYSDGKSIDIFTTMPFVIDNVCSPVVVLVSTEFHIKENQNFQFV